MKSVCLTDVRTPMSTATLFTVDKIWSQLKYISKRNCLQDFKYPCHPIDKIISIELPSYLAPYSEHLLI